MQEALQHWLAAQGVTDTRGIDLLRQLRSINNLYEAALAETVQDDAISPQRWRVLIGIWTEERMGGGPVYPTRLSRAERVSKNTISEHLRGLEEAGLIVRELDQQDRRQFRIRLSEAGRALVSRCAPLHMRRLNHLLDGMTDDEVADLQRLLARLTEVVRANAALPPPANCTGAHPSSS